MAIFGLFERDTPGRAHLVPIEGRDDAHFRIGGLGEKACEPQNKQPSIPSGAFARLEATPGGDGPPGA